MLDEVLKKRVERASVKFPEKGGQGILIRSDIILTAMHVLQYEREDLERFYLDVFQVEKIETYLGDLKVYLLACDPVSDIAALKCVPDLTYVHEYNNYVAFCENTNPIPLAIFSREDFNQDNPLMIDAFIYTHEAKWLEIKVTLCKDPELMKSMWIESQEPFQYGTSGSAIVNEHGELIGVVSHASEGHPPYTGLAPCACKALPVWVIDLIEEPNT